ALGDEREGRARGQPEGGRRGDEIGGAGDECQAKDRQGNGADGDARRGDAGAHGRTAAGGWGSAEGGGGDGEDDEAGGGKGGSGGFEIVGVVEEGRQVDGERDVAAEGERVEVGRLPGQLHRHRLAQGGDEALAHGLPVGRVAHHREGQHRVDD